MMKLLLALTVLSCLTHSALAAAPVIVSESTNRLPMSLSTVIADLEAEGMTEISMACVITSKSVTQKEKRAVLEAMLNLSKEEEEDYSQCKALATAKGLALGLCQAQTTQSLEEVVSTAVACQGLLFYVPSQNDLMRGEGLMDTLAPAMERLLQWQEQQHLAGNDDWEHKSCLVVVYDPKVGQEETKARLNAAATPILETFTTLSHNQKVSTLQDVFSEVLYMTPDQVESSILNHQQRPYQTTTPEAAMASVAATVAADAASQAYFPPMVEPSSTRILTHPQELAAARNLEPAKRAALEQALQKVEEATAQNTQLVTNFGDLCDAVLQQAKDTFQAAASHASPKLLQSTSVGKELTASISQELASEWMDVFEEQLRLLQQASFQEFQQSLGKLRLGPTLEQSMDEIVQSTVKQFATRAQNLLPHKVPNARSVWKDRANDHKVALRKQLRAFCQERLQAAQASGQFKPIPRKGVTIGMHWLLPKPFGNDYRQEPWMVHASDDMVYVPRRKTKVTDVSPDSIKTGDWRDQVAPSPAGNDMLYMQ